MNDDAVEASKKELRERFPAEELPGEGWGKAAERLRKIEPYRNARCIAAGIGRVLHQIRLNALGDRKLLVLPTPGLQGGFLLLDPAAIPVPRRAEAVNPEKNSRYGIKLNYDGWMGLPVDLVVTDALAVTVEGNRLGDGSGHLDIQVAVLIALGILKPDATVIAVTEERRVTEEIPMAATDVRVHWIVTPERVVRTSHAGPCEGRIDWEKLDEKRIRRNDVLHFLHRRTL